jgi:hypothetical protein
MRERLDFSKDRVDEVCSEYYLQYGTTLSGLVVSYPASMASPRNWVTL